MTIVIPVRNRAQQVSATLGSILAQTYRPLHVVLVDNASTDATVSVLEAWKRENEEAGLKIDVLCESKPGASAARNRGLSAVDTEWVMFFDSDDLMAIDHVERAMEVLRENPQARIIGWPVLLKHLDGHKSVEKFYGHDAMFHCVHHGSMATQRYMARTGLVCRVGGWREDVMVWNDIELGTRLLNAIEFPDEIVEIDGNPTVRVIAGVESITGVRYSDRVEARGFSLDCIAANLPASEQWIVNLKRAILAGLCAREGAKEKAQNLMRKIPTQNRAFLYLAYQYTAWGGRGAARLLRPLY